MKLTKYDMKWKIYPKRMEKSNMPRKSNEKAGIKTRKIIISAIMIWC